MTKEYDREFLEELPGTLENKDKEYKEYLNEKIKEREIKMKKSIFSLIFGLIALLLAFLVAYGIIPAGWETYLLPVITSIAGAFGVANWRTNYGLAKEWYKSKSIIFGILGAVVVLILVAINFFGFGLASWIITLINALLGIFGAGTLYGIFDAMKKNE